MLERIPLFRVSPVSYIVLHFSPSSFPWSRPPPMSPANAVYALIWAYHVILLSKVLEQTYVIFVQSFCLDSPSPSTPEIPLYHVCFISFCLRIFIIIVITRKSTFARTHMTTLAVVRACVGFNVCPFHNLLPLSPESQKIVCPYPSLAFVWHVDDCSPSAAGMRRVPRPDHPV